MSSQIKLDSYIAQVQRRLRMGTSLRGIAILAGTALGLTLALVPILNRMAFPARGVVGARWALIAALVAAAALGLAWPLFRLTRARAVLRAEAAHPELEGRLTTFQEREREHAGPFLELLAADTLARTDYAPAASLAPASSLFALTGAGLACLGVLMWIIAAGPGYVGYGASLLWMGAKKNVAPLYAITVTPGDVAVRRNSDQLVTARVKGLRPDKVRIFARYASASGWEPVTMQAQPDSSGPATYQFLFAGLPENVEYYVTAGPLVSPHYKVRVMDLPSVKSIRVTYHYPRWTGMKPVTEEHSGDLRALQGTDAAIEIEMDRPLKDGQLTLDSGKPIHLTGVEGARYQGTIHMEKDGAYHVAATDSGQTVRLSEDYFIATDKPMPPEIAIDRPGGDYRASPIEEVTVGVKAADTFGLRDVHLHYSVNGGPDRSVDLLKSPGAQSADGSFVLRLEDFKLVPGDLVSLYATAKDGNAEARTDISFIQADPFEREFSQSQQEGGGGGGGGGGQNDQTEMSKREKELVAQTWKQVNDKTATAKDAAASGQFLAKAQSKLRDQVLALSARMGTRDLADANEEFNGFAKDMQTAASAMAPSADKLKGMQWKDALPLEQKALQSLLRAEATFRQIQVAFGQRGGGGGGGGSAGRDLASLFDLELDTAKNQYETAQTASPAEQHEKDVEDALEKLDALAKRQEELANQQHNPQQTFQERWQQEMLRREAEQLQRQMEQLAQNQQGQQGGQQSSSPSSSGQAGSQADSQSDSQSGSQSGSQSASQSGSQSSSSSSQQQASSQGGLQGETGSSALRRQSGGSSADQGSARGDASRRQQAAGRNQSGSGQSSDQRIEQALNRLRQAGDAMKRSGGSPQAGDAARQAADRLREATNLLGSTQQQLASGKLDSIAHEAHRLSQEERAQAAQIDQLANRQSDFNPMDQAGMMARIQKRDRLAAERQQLSNDVSKLQSKLRESAREMAPNQPGAAQKLRDALTEMDQTDLDNHVQRTADWLRRGINPNSNGTEGEIAQGLQKLDQQIQQAQQGMGQIKPGQGQERGSSQGDQVAALSQVERLRSEIEAMAARGGTGRQPDRNGQNGQQGRSGQTGQQGRDSQGNRPGDTLQRGQGGQPGGSETGQLSRGNNSGRPSQNGQGSGQQSGQQGGQQQAGGQRGGQQGGSGVGRSADGQAGGNGSDLAGNRDGAIRNGEMRVGGGGGADGTAWNNFNTGANQYGQSVHRPVPTDASGNPADTQRAIEQGLRELNRLRQMVQGDPQAAREVQQLAQQMQRLDPSRFPGNPAMVEQMHREVLNSVDRLELQLNRDGASTDAHTGKPYVIPPGYQDSVAEYYRRLSTRQ